MRYLIFTFLLALGACGSLGNPNQGDAGLTIVDLTFCPDQDDGRKYICGVHFSDGKEKQSVDVTVGHPSGVTVTYSARAVKAFDAIEARAAVDRAIADSSETLAPAVVEAIVKALTSQ